MPFPKAFFYLVPPAYSARRGRVGDERVAYPFVLKSFAHHTGVGEQLLKKLRAPGVPGTIIDIQHYGSGQVSCVIVLVHHQRAHPCGLLPVDGFHGLPAGIVPESDSQHWVFEYEAADRNVAHEASQGAYHLVCFKPFGENDNFLQLPERYTCFFDA